MPVRAAAGSEGLRGGGQSPWGGDGGVERPTGHSHRLRAVPATPRGPRRRHGAPVPPAPRRRRWATTAGGCRDSGAGKRSPLPALSSFLGLIAGIRAAGTHLGLFSGNAGLGSGSEPRSHQRGAAACAPLAQNRGVRAPCPASPWLRQCRCGEPAGRCRGGARGARRSRAGDTRRPGAGGLTLLETVTDTPRGELLLSVVAAESPVRHGWAAAGNGSAACAGPAQRSPWLPRHHAGSAPARPAARGPAARWDGGTGPMRRGAPRRLRWCRRSAPCRRLRAPVPPPRPAPGSAAGWEDRGHVLRRRRTGPGRWRCPRQRQRQPRHGAPRVRPPRAGGAAQWPLVRGNGPLR